MQRLLKTSKVILTLICSIGIMLFGTSCEMDSPTYQEENENYGLEIINTKGVNAQGVLTVSGDVKNVSNENVKKLIIIVTFYNSSQEELTTVQDISEDILLPDETYHFNINCLKKEASIYDIEVRAES